MALNLFLEFGGVWPMPSDPVLPSVPGSTGRALCAQIRPRLWARVNETDRDWNREVQAGW